MAKSKSKAKPGVLADDKKVGSKFIPPFVADIGPIQEVRWVTDLVPELLWISLLHSTHGLKNGADLARQLALAALGTQGQKPKKWFAFASSYAALDTLEQDAVMATLQASQALGEVREGLRPLVQLYPECPLRFLVPDERGNGAASLINLKTVLESILDRWESPATFTQATAVYIAFTSDMLKVFSGLALANFPAIEEFPKTEESKQVAASVRSVVSMFSGHFTEPTSNSWISYFWRRGLELEPCSTQATE